MSFSQQFALDYSKVIKTYDGLDCQTNDHFQDHQARTYEQTHSHHHEIHHRRLHQEAPHPPIVCNLFLNKSRADTHDDEQELENDKKCYQLQVHDVDKYTKSPIRGHIGKKYTHCMALCLPKDCDLKLTQGEQSNDVLSRNSEKNERKTKVDADRLTKIPVKIKQNQNDLEPSKEQSQGTCASDHLKHLRVQQDSTENKDASPTLLKLERFDEQTKQTKTKKSVNCSHSTTAELHLTHQCETSTSHTSTVRSHKSLDCTQSTFFDRLLVSSSLKSHDHDCSSSARNQADSAANQESSGSQDSPNDLNDGSSEYLCATLTHSSLPSVENEAISFHKCQACRLGKSTFFHKVTEPKCIQASSTSAVSVQDDSRTNCSDSSVEEECQSTHDEPSIRHSQEKCRSKHVEECQSTHDESSLRRCQEKCRFKHDESSKHICHSTHEKCHWQSKSKNCFLRRCHSKIDHCCLPFECHPTPFRRCHAVLEHKEPLDTTKKSSCVQTKKSRDYIKSTQVHSNDENDDININKTSLCCRAPFDFSVKSKEDKSRHKINKCKSRTCKEINRVCIKKKMRGRRRAVTDKACHLRCVHPAHKQKIQLCQRDQRRKVHSRRLHALQLPNTQLKVQHGHHQKAMNPPVVLKLFINTSRTDEDVKSKESENNKNTNLVQRQDLEENNKSRVDIHAVPSEKTKLHTQDRAKVIHGSRCCERNHAIDLHKHKVRDLCEAQNVPCQRSSFGRCDGVTEHFQEPTKFICVSPKQLHSGQAGRTSASKHRKVMWHEVF